ncbi:hypothetical protein K1719_012773 [Acacia pycnantha]|nr:hypothetical protein K1719_012773 [Acacia pycnantha]
MATGKIMVEELQMVIKSLRDDCSLAGCWLMIHRVDSISDGQIDFEEFKVKMMMGSHHDSSDTMKPEQEEEEARTF